METIKLLDTTRMRQEEAFGYYTLVDAEYGKCTDVKFIPVYNTFKEALRAFEKALRQISASEFTQKLTVLDTKRDNAYRAFHASVIYGKQISDIDKAEAACRLQLILNKYDNPIALPYIQENAILTNLLEDLSQQQTDVEAIGASVWVNEMQTTNDAFITLFSERNTEQAAIMMRSSIATRSQIDIAYRACVNRINALVEINGEAEYLEIIQAINNLIDYEKTVLATRKTHAGKNKQEPATE